MKRRTVNHLYSGQGLLLIATTHVHEGLVPCLVDVRGFELYNKQTQRGGSWNVDKPKNNGEDVSMGRPQLERFRRKRYFIEGNQGIG